jgi:hypothetical protein
MRVSRLPEESIWPVDYSSKPTAYLGNAARRSPIYLPKQCDLFCQSTLCNEIRDHCVQFVYPGVMFAPEAPTPHIICDRLPMLTLTDRRDSTRATPASCLAAGPRLGERQGGPRWLCGVPEASHDDGAMIP